MPAEHHPVATQLAVDLGFIDATSHETIMFVPLSQQQDQHLSREVSPMLLYMHNPRSMGQEWGFVRLLYIDNRNVGRLRPSEKWDGESNGRLSLALDVSGHITLTQDEE